MLASPASATAMVNRLKNNDKGGARYAGVVNFRTHLSLNDRATPGLKKPKQTQRIPCKNANRRAQVADHGKFK